jgi:hypothetical protein
MFTTVVPLKGMPIHTNFVVGTSLLQLTQVNPNRKTLIIQNQGAGVVYIGSATISNGGATIGYALAAGATFTDNATNTDWWVISATGGSNAIHVIEVT